MFYSNKLSYVLLTIHLLFFLFGCNSSEKEKLCTINTDQTVSLSCNGGYSYWVSPLYSLSGDTLAVTGVKTNKGKSEQWVSFFRSDLSEVKLEHSFPLQFKADEHNAPAVLALDQERWIVARTGHNSVSEDSLGQIELTLFNKDLSIESQVTLNTQSGTTYSQLVSANDKLYLLTRDKLDGWGIFTSPDEGGTWSDWEMISTSFGRLYLQMSIENSVGQLYDKIIISKANHPLEPEQYIAYSFLDLVEDDPSNALVDNIRLGEVSDSNAYTLQLQVSSEGHSNTRLLDVANHNSSLCHLYSSQNNIDNTEEWQLNIIISDLNNNSKVNFEVGHYNGILGDNSYITGASIKSCRYEDGESIKVLVTSILGDNSEYGLLSVTIDAQTGIVLSEDILYTSQKKLYRPVYLKSLDYVMLNEMDYWNNYEDWQANQIIIKL